MVWYMPVIIVIISYKCRCAGPILPDILCQKNCLQKLNGIYWNIYVILFCLNFGCDAIMTKGVAETDFLYHHHYLIIRSYLVGCSERPPRPKQKVGSERPWHKESHDMPDSVRDGLWRPRGAFFQIGLGCVMSHQHTEGLCTFLF